MPVRMRDRMGRSWSQPVAIWLVSTVIPISVAAAVAASPRAIETASRREAAAHRLAEREEQEEVAGRRPVEVVLAGARPRGHAGEQHDGRHGEPGDELPLGLRGPGHELDDEAHPEPGQDGQRLARDVLEEPVRSDPAEVLDAARALEEERHPPVLGIPDDHRREDAERNGQREVRAGCASQWRCSRRVSA